MDPGAGREQIQLQGVPGYSRHGPVEVQALRSSRRTKELDRGPLVVEGGGGGSWAKVDEPGRTGAAGLRKYRSEVLCHSRSALHTAKSVLPW
jgi:hypothetical protein